MSDEDYCVYARGVLGRLGSVMNPTTSFISDATVETTSNTSDPTQNMGIMFLIFLVAFFMMATYKNKPSTTASSKLD